MGGAVGRSTKILFEVLHTLNRDVRSKINTKALI